MTARKTKSAPCEVGYGNPPRLTRFRKGRSGNPRGRPPRHVSRERMKALTLQEAYRALVLKEDGRAVPVPAPQAILRSQVELAAKGNIRARHAILAAVRAFEQGNEMDAKFEGMLAVWLPHIDRIESRVRACEHEPDEAERDTEEAP